MIDYVSPTLDLLTKDLIEQGFSKEAEHIKLLWGTQEVSDYIFKILVEADRELPKDTVSTFLKLSSLHHGD